MSTYHRRRTHGRTWQADRVGTCSNVTCLRAGKQTDLAVAAARERYPNSLVVVAPGEAHGFIGILCHASILADVIAQGSAAGLQTGCLEQVELPAIIIGE